LVGALFDISADIYCNPAAFEEQEKEEDFKVLLNAAFGKRSRERVVMTCLSTSFGWWVEV
jgi:hypothetical protein